MNRVFVIEHGGKPYVPVKAYATEGRARGAMKTSSWSWSRGTAVPYVPETELTALQERYSRLEALAAHVRELIAEENYATAAFMLSDIGKEVVA